MHKKIKVTSFFLSSFSATKFRIALVQLLVGADKGSNLTRASKLIREAAANAAQIIVLPECFNSPYGTQYFRQYFETIPGESTSHLSEIAKETNTYVVGGEDMEL